MVFNSDLLKKTAGIDRKQALILLKKRLNADCRLGGDYHDSEVGRGRPLKPGAALSDATCLGCIVDALLAMEK